MRVHPRLYSLLLAGGCLVASSTTVADATHYQTLQLGNRSRGMASAFTGVAADASAIYFNPGGLATTENRTLQGALSIAHIRKRTSKGAIVFDDGTGSQERDFVLKSSPSLPGFAATTFGLGKKDAAGRQRIGMSVGAFQVYNVEFSTDVQIPDPEGRTNTIQLDQTDRQTWIGAGVGWRAYKKFHIGVSLFGVRQTLRHNEQLALSLEGDPRPGEDSPPFFQDSFFLSRTTRFSLENWALVARIGILQHINDRWRIGVMVQPPGVRVGGKASLRFQLNEVNATVDPALTASFFGEQGGFSSRAPIPWEIRFGVAHELAKRFIVDVDLQLVGRVKENSIAPSVPNIPERSPSTGVFLATSTKRDFTWNVSVGADVDITHYLFIRFGFLSDRTAAPNPGDPSSGVVRLAGNDRYGFTFSVGGHKNGNGLSAGLAALWGTGIANGIDTTVLTPDGPSGDFFRSVPVKERILIISIGGNIGKAKATLDDIKKDFETDDEFDARQDKEMQKFKQEQDEERRHRKAIQQQG